MRLPKLLITFSILPGLLAAEVPVPQKAEGIPTGLVPLRPATPAQFAFLCMEATKHADEKLIIASLVKWFKLESADEIRRFSYKAETQTFSWGIGKSRFVATFDDSPIPKSDIRYASKNSLHWPDAEKEMLKHKAHFTLSCTSIHRESWRAALDLSRALSALAECHNAVGMYWGDASIVHSTASFLKQAEYKEGQAIPCMLWVGILFDEKKDGSWNAFTDGLNPLGFQDVEIHHSELSQLALYKILLATTEQVISSQTALQAGDVIEDADGNEWKVAAAQSIIGRPKPIWTLVPVE